MAMDGVARHLIFGGLYNWILVVSLLFFVAPFSVFFLLEQTRGALQGDRTAQAESPRQSKVRNL